LVDAQDRGEALRSINALMAPARARDLGGQSSEPGYFRLNGFADRDFAIGFFSSDLGLKAHISAEREPCYFLIFGVLGELPLEVGKQRVLSTRSVATVVNPGERLAVLPEREPTESLVIRLARPFVERELTALLGMEPRADVRFDPALDLSRPGPSGVRELLGGILGQLDSEYELLARPAMRRAEMRLLVTSLLLAHHHTQVASLRHEAAPMLPRHLDRAIGYIERHLGEQITLGDIAEAAGRSARTVDAGFRSCLGVSPMTYVRNLRLESVRAALLTTGEAISTIALDAGFTHLGRFASAYRARYGELPSQTRAGL
jgi:AraC-like DNA-binding protein